MIRNIQLRHAGKYTCAVQTKVDSVSIATDVVVRGEWSAFFSVFQVKKSYCMYTNGSKWPLAINQDTKK